MAPNMCKTLYIRDCEASKDWLLQTQPLPSLPRINMSSSSHQQPLLNRTLQKSSSSKHGCLILSLTAVFYSSAFFASSFFFNLSLTPHHHHHHYHLCQLALHKPSCLAHVSEVSKSSSFFTTKDQSVNLLKSFLIKSTSQIERAMHTASSIKDRVNSPTQEAALLDCEQLMDLSLDRIWDSIVALTENTSQSQLHNAHTWLSSVLTNHVTCLGGLHGLAGALMEAELQDLMSRASTSLAILLAALTPEVDVIAEPLNGDFPSWVRREDRRLLEATSAKEIKTNVVVAKDGSGRFKTVAEAVASAPDNGKTRYVIYVKKGKYKENVEIGKKKKKVMLVGDGMGATIITGSLNVVDGSTTYKSATVGTYGFFINFAHAS